MGDLHLVLPALNLFTSKIGDVLTEHGGLLNVLLLPLTVNLKLGGK